MKITDVISESSEVNEAPVGMVQRAANAVMSKVPGRIGQRAQGRRDVSQIANAMWKQFQRYIGQAGLDPKAITTDQLSQFIKQTFKYSDQTINQGLQQANARPGIPLNSKAIEKALLGVAKVSMQATGQQVGGAPGTAGSQAGTGQAGTGQAGGGVQQILQQLLGLPIAQQQQIVKILKKQQKQQRKQSAPAANPAPAAGTGQPTQ